MGGISDSNTLEATPQYRRALNIQGDVIFVTRATTQQTTTVVGTARAVGDVLCLLECGVHVEVGGLVPGAEEVAVELVVRLADVELELVAVHDVYSVEHVWVLADARHEFHRMIEFGVFLFNDFVKGAFDASRDADTRPVSFAVVPREGAPVVRAAHALAVGVPRKRTEKVLRERGELCLFV